MKSISSLASFCFCFPAAALLALGEGKVPSFRAVDVDLNVAIGYGLAVADVDGDGKRDLVLADKREVVWYRNPEWQKFVLAENLTKNDNVCLAAADINGDGKTEVAIGAEWNPGDTVNSGAVFYLIPPADRTQRWDPVRLPHEPTVHRMRWVKNSRGKFDLVVVPLHGRGNKRGEGEGVRILAYQMPGNPREPWTTTLLNQSLHATHNFDPVQWDRDPADELLVAGREGVFLIDQETKKLTPLGKNHPGETGFPGAGEVRAGRLRNGDRYIATVEPMHGNSVAVYTAPASGSNDLWTRHVIDDTLVEGHAVACGDLLKAGFDQIVVGWRAMNKPGRKVGIKLFLPLDELGKQWESHLIDDNTMDCEDLLLDDLNGDGWIDVVAAGRATKNLKVYFNQGLR